MRKLTERYAGWKLRVSVVEQTETSWAPVISLHRESLPALDALKRRLLEAHLGRADKSLHSWLRRAADDAVSLAWTQPFPWLFLPDLLDEKAEQARRAAQFQQSVSERGPSWTSLAA